MNPAQAFVAQGRWIHLLGAAACLALTGLGYLAGLGPMLEARRTYEADETAYLAEAAESVRLQRTLRRLESELASVQAEVGRTTVRLSPPATAPLHVAAMARLAGECGLRIDDIQTAPPLTKPYATAVPVHVSGEGTYAACARFLARLRRFLPETSVESIALEAAGPAPGRPTPAALARATFRLRLVWHAALPPGPPAGAVTRAAGRLPVPARRSPSP